MGGRSPRTCPAAISTATRPRCWRWPSTQRPDRTYCTTWDYTDKQGNFRRVGFVARTAMEAVEDGTEHLIGRAMNLAGDLDESAVPPDHLAQRILNGLSQPGVHRALVDLKNWNLLKWLDEPCPYYDWRAARQFHPDDQPKLAAMTEEFESGATTQVLRLPGNDGGWVPMHVTVNRVELDSGHLRRPDHACGCRPTVNWPTPSRSTRTSGSA